MKERYDRKLAIKVAKEICDWISPVCERLIVAGSLRRRRLSVGDVEILFIPKMVPRKLNDLFKAPELIPLMDGVLDEHLKRGALAKRPNIKGNFTWGQEIKLAVHASTGMPVDFFTATPDNWFNYLVCRTGSGRSNIAIASAAQKKGWKWQPYGAGFRDEYGEVVKVASEEDVFRFVGLKYLHPWERE